MQIGDLVEQYLAVRAPGWLVLDSIEAQECAIAAARLYAGYGDIKSLSHSDVLQQAPGADVSLPLPPDPAPDVVPALPVKDMELIDSETELTTGEWAIIAPLFRLYCERESAMRLEASRGMGVDVYGRSVSEVSQEITMMETETIPSKSFVSAILTVA